VGSYEEAIEGEDYDQNQEIDGRDGFLLTKSNGDHLVIGVLGEEGRRSVAVKQAAFREMNTML
jgi:hypothetical protein